jgi:hypothetical protein
MSLKKQKSLRYSEVESKSKSWAPVIRNGWWIKFSTYKETNILLLFISKHTGQSIVRYFTNEDDAVEYINYVTSMDSTLFIIEY